MKLERKRLMYFTAFDKTPTPESATASVSGTGVSAASVTASTFGNKVSHAAGTYAFAYTTEWKLNGTSVTITDYGITLTGSPVSGDGVSVTYTPASGGWEVLGRDNDDLSKELNPDTETSKNVLGEATFKHNGYEPEVSVDPYYADDTSPLYNKLLTAAIQEKYGDEDIKGYFTEVVFTTVDEDAGTMSGTGYMREAYIVPQSTGGDTSGLGIPFNVHPVGSPTTVAVTYTIATRAVTIVEPT